MRYAVIKTPTCVKCKVFEQLVKTNGMEDVAFITVSSAYGQQLIQKYNIRSGGAVVDIQEERVLTEEEVTKLFKS